MTSLLDWVWAVFQLTSVLVLIIILVNFFIFPILNELVEDKPEYVQHRCEEGRPDDPSMVERPNPGLVKVIRLTNSGEFVDRCELTDALMEMVWSPTRQTPPVRSEAKDVPRIALLYIHGWKHSGKPNDSDLKNFQALVKSTSDRYGSSKHVFGVYVAWNASLRWSIVESLYLGFLENLTFWTKKSIADRIAHSAAVTKIVSSLGATRNLERGDQLFAIGHSFGARLLFSAVGQFMIYETEKSHPGRRYGEYRPIETATDTVILLNPAFEASLYTTFNSILRNEESFSSAQRPLSIVVSSTADKATRHLPNRSMVGWRSNDSRENHSWKSRPLHHSFFEEDSRRFNGNN